MRTDIVTDIVIVGGGAIGLAAAWRLALAGVGVIVVDGRSASPRATKAAAGMLAPSFERAERHAVAASSPALADLSLASLRMWAGFAPELEAASGQSIDFRDDGILGVATTDAEADALTRQAELMAAAGVGAELLDGRAARALEPLLAEGVIAGLLAREEAQVDPVLLVEALETAVRRAGVQIVHAIASVFENGPDGSGVRMRLASGGAISADRAIVSTGAGAFARRLSGNASIVTPVKGEALAFAPGAAVPRRVIRGRNAYICPRQDGRVVIGATERPGDASLETDDERVDGLRAAATRIVPAFERANESSRWAGLRPVAPDGAPIIGPAAGDPRVIYAIGHYRNGILLAPATAEIIRACATANSPEWPKPFLPDRFATPARKLALPSAPSSAAR